MKFVLSVLLMMFSAVPAFADSPKGGLSCRAIKTAEGNDSDLTLSPEVNHGIAGYIFQDEIVKIEMLDFSGTQIEIGFTPADTKSITISMTRHHVDTSYIDMTTLTTYRVICDSN